jgi:hypothetical protein
MTAPKKINKFWRNWIIIKFVALFSALGYVLYDNHQGEKAYQNSFMSNSDDEQAQILSTLGVNDLILCYDSVYRIDSLTETTIIILKSNITPDYRNISIFDPIDPTMYSDESFIYKIEVNKEKFYNGTLDSPLQSVQAILDR